MLEGEPQDPNTTLTESTRGLRVAHADRPLPPRGILTEPGQSNLRPRHHSIPSGGKKAGSDSDPMMGISHGPWIGADGAPRKWGTKS